LVPNKSYESFEVELYQNSILLQTDTTDTTGYFSFAGLDAATYELKATANFGYENIAYANDIFVLTDTLLEKALLLDSLKYDFSKIRVGYNYTFLARRICAGIFGTDTMLSQIEITITDSYLIEDTLFYDFTGDQYYSTFPDCYAIPDSHYVLTGYFKDYNNQVICVINGDGGAELSECFRGIHIYDGSDELKQFLEFGGTPLEIEYGVLIEINNQQYETLYMNYYFPMNGSTDTKYNFSHQLGTVYSKRWSYMGNHGAGGPEIILVDFDF